MLGHKRGNPDVSLGMKRGMPGNHLGNKGAIGTKNYLQNIKNQSPHHSPVEKFARSSNALGQYA